jgi:hypothetical protein
MPNVSTTFYFTAVKIADNLVYRSPAFTITPTSGGGGGEPPTFDDTVDITFPNDPVRRDHLSITITTKNGTPVPPSIIFYVWFWPATTTGNSSLQAKADNSYYGPFVVNSVANADGGTDLDIDVNNLLTPEETKGSIPAGSYKIQFADKDTGSEYVGTIEAIALQGTSDSETQSSGGGGCNAGYGLFGLLLAGMVMRKYHIG